MKAKHDCKGLRDRRSRRIWEPLFLAAAIGIASSGATTAQEDRDALDGMRAALEQWVETRRLISQERRDWADGKQLLEDRIDLVQREIDSLVEGIEESARNIAEAEKKRSELVAENDQLEQASAVFAETVVSLERRTQELLGRMPDPVIEKVKTLSQRIPADPDSTKLGLSDRYLNIIGILNEVDRFNREVTLTSEVHTLPGGTTAEVAVMYVGFGQAYYVSNTGEHAGVGTTSEEGWAWKPANDAAGSITKAIAVLKNEIAAEFVQLPIQIN